MAQRSRHGAARNFGTGPCIEVLPPNELPIGVPAPQQATPARPHRGKINSSARAAEIGALGGKAKAGTTRLSREVQLTPSSPELAPYLKAAAHFRRMHTRQLAESVGGGVCGAGPASLIASAALQLAFSRHAFEHGKAELGSKLANDSRQNLLAAHELAAREAKARPRVTPDWFRPDPEPDASDASDDAEQPDDGEPDPEAADALRVNVEPAIEGGE